MFRMISHKRLRLEIHWNFTVRHFSLTVIESKCYFMSYFFKIKKQAILYLYPTNEILQGICFIIKLNKVQGDRI